MIPKIIWTIWLNDDPKLPEIVSECIESQKIPGYEHRLITLENCDRSSRYVREAIASKRWVKASDFLRMQYLVKEGGIYLDADMKILPGKNFDELLNHRMFITREVAYMWANAALGAEPNHPLLIEYLRHVEDNYRGDGELVFQPGIRAFDDVFWNVDLEKNGILYCATDMFFPFNHFTGETNIKPYTIVNHLYLKSWLPK